MDYKKIYFNYISFRWAGMAAINYIYSTVHKKTPFTITRKVCDNDIDHSQCVMKIRKMLSTHTALYKQIND